MNASSSYVRFDQVAQKLSKPQLREFGNPVEIAVQDVSQAAFDALQSPIDFPAIGEAVIAGDRVALAVDPNVPDLVQVLRGVVKAIEQSEPECIDIVLWDETTSHTLAEVRSEFADLNVLTHQCHIRDELMFLGADNQDEAVYVNRVIVDADFVLPVIAARQRDAQSCADVTGIFPAFADSAARARRLVSPVDPSSSETKNETLVPWQLGILVGVVVSASAAGHVAKIVVGSLPALATEIKSLSETADMVSLERSSLLIASLDGGHQQQTWVNAVRAVIAATELLDEGGTIVLWTEIDSLPTGRLAALPERPALPTDMSVNAEGQLPSWDPTIPLATEMAGAIQSHRIMMRCRLPSDTIEALGMGVVESVDQLSRLCEAFESCGVLRAAQFTGSSSCNQQLDDPIHEAD